MSDTALGIDIGSHSVKAVLLRRRGNRVQVVRAGSAMLEELGHMDDSRRRTTKVAMIVRNLLRSAGIRSGPVRVAVGGRKSIIRYTRVPPAPPWRLKMLIDYEVEGDTEGKGKDLAYDFRLLDLPTAHVEFTVMIAMARNELVENHCEILKEAGVRVDNVTLTPFPVFNTYVHNRGTAIEDDKTHLLMDIGAESLNIVVQRNGKLLFARNISPGGRAFTEAVQDEFRLPFAEAEELKCSKGRLLLGDEDIGGDETRVSPSSDAPTEISGPDGEQMSYLVAELGPELSTEETDQVPQLSEAMLPVAGRLAAAIQSSLMYCRAQTRMTELEVDEMVLTGGGSRLPGVRQVLSRRLGIPAVPAEPLKGLDLGPLKRDAREEVENHAETYPTAIGLALECLEPEAVQFNLLPQRIKARRRFRQKTLYLWLAAAAMLALMVLVGYSSWSSNTSLEGYVERKARTAAAFEQEKGRVDNLKLVNGEYQAEVGLMRRYVLRPRQMVRVFRALAEHVPKEVMLTSLKPILKKSGPRNEIIVEGHVLKSVEKKNGNPVPLSKTPQRIIRELVSKLETDPAFKPPGGGESSLERENLDPGGNKAAEFQLRLVMAEVQ